MRQFATIVLIGLTGFVTPLLAQSSAQLALSAQVQVHCTIHVQALPKAANLNLLDGETNSPVGLVTENCNSPNGYTVTIASASAGKLTPQFSLNIDTPYTVQYDDAQGHIGDTLRAQRTQAQFNKQATVHISVGANPQKLAGNFEDTLQFVIQAR